MSHDLKKENECRIAYADIVRGYSTHKDFFLKHYTELDIAETERTKKHFEEDGRREKLISETEKLQLLEEKGHWSKDEEASYQEARIEIEQQRFSLKRLIVPQQINDLLGRIEQNEKEFYSKFATRGQLLGVTLEQYANRRASENHILRSFYKNSKLTIPYLSLNDTDELSVKEMSIFIDIYQQTHSMFFDKNFKRIAVCPFFLNGYQSCNENPEAFFGKPVVHLTLYQLALFSKGRYYKNILSEPEARTPPEEYYEDLDSVVKFYDSQWSIILGKRHNNQLIR